MAPHFEEAAQKLAGEAVLLKMNADQCSTPARLGVRAIPTLILFVDGIEVARHAGAMSAGSLAQWIRARGWPKWS
jgi:thioredoxin 2